MMELLAPAGNFECVVAAVQNGADAVYFSGEEYGARSYAENFDKKSLERAADYCRLRGVKTHITVNTLCTDRELARCAEYVKFLAEIGVDAVIVQDLGVFEMIRRMCPSLPIHASTQMTVHNLGGALALQKMGARRVVLSRELTFENIKNISENSDIELEVFAHGALCMCYSGQCLMSSVFGGRSGNRGRCAQPCRLKYSVNGGEEISCLSLKDLSLAEHIGELDEAGVTSLKIEGRMRGAGYVAAVTKVFRECIDTGKPPTPENAELLKRVFYRDEFTDGYFVGRGGRNMFTLSRIENPYTRSGAELERMLEATYKNVENIKNKINCRVRIAEGEKPEAEMRCRDFSVAVKSDGIAARAEKRPANAETVKAQFGKTGDVPFEFEKTEVEISGAPFMPVSEINELRRRGIAALENEMKKPPEREVNEYLPERFAKRSQEKLKFTCSVFNAEQLGAVLKRAEGFARIYVPVCTAVENIDRLCGVKGKIVISLPAVSRGEEYKTELERLFAAGFENVQANNISQICYADKNLFGGFRMNLFSGAAVRVCANLGFKGVCLSPELNFAQIRAAAGAAECEVIGYGRLPLMITENCPAQNARGCAGCDGVNVLTDRKGEKLPVLRLGKSCTHGERSFVILNSAPIFIADRLKEAENAGVSAVNLYFTVENGEECEHICELYFEGKRPENLKYTRGHFNKGVI